MTTHKILYSEAQQMNQIDDNSVDLVVTSPPYPMIEMWDEIFFNQNNEIQKEFKNGNFGNSFELMHLELDKIWKECHRVLVDGGIACINIGDATRTLNKNFRLFSNHSRIIQGHLNLGFQNLPNIIWRKTTHAPNKFMGSGMLPPSAYVTLEHEFILIFRKGGKREFDSRSDIENRRWSSYFWEERNTWFSNLWDIKGTMQKLLGNNLNRERSAAYPIELPYRLINMFSVQNGLVLDPFFGTGTTTIAALASNRNSIGYEIDTSFKKLIEKRIRNVQDNINELISNRLNKHLRFVDGRKKTKGKESFKYTNVYYGFPVVTSQETKIKIPFIKNVTFEDDIIMVDYFNEIGIKAPNSLTLF